MVYLLIFLALFIVLFFLSRLLASSLQQLFLKISRSHFFAIKVFHLLLLPGVVIHELAHLIVAEVMLVRTGGLSFSMQQEEDRIVMGSVGIEQTDPIRRAIIGFAPVFVGILLIAFFVFYFLSPDTPISYPWNYALVLFVVFQIGNTMFSSRRDLEGTLQLVLVISLGIIVGYLLGFRIPETFFEFLNSQRFVEIVERGIKILLFPIGINIVVILLAELMSKKY